MYFIKTYSNNHKNSLQKGIIEALKDINQKLVADPENLLSQIREKLTELNAKNPRCTPARVDHYFVNYTDDDSYKSIYVLVGEWGFIITLYKVTGEIENSIKQN